MKEIKFTGENRIRHFLHNPDIITTTRDKILGDIGEKFIIYDHMLTAHEFTLESIWITDSLGLGVNSFPRIPIWHQEGFECNHDFIEELLRIYPATDCFYVHILRRVIS